jgi:hypothetical protein
MRTSDVVKEVGAAVLVLPPPPPVPVGRTTMLELRIGKGPAVDVTSGPTPVPVLSGTLVVRMTAMEEVLVTMTGMSELLVTITGRAEVLVRITLLSDSGRLLLGQILARNRLHSVHIC